MTTPAIDRPLLLPKRISGQHYLAKNLRASFSDFKLEQTSFSLKPEMSGVIATAQTFDLSVQAARKLGRKTNSVEAALAPLRDVDALKPVQKLMVQWGVPDGDESAFYALEVRRRLSGKLVDRDSARLPANIRRQLGDLLSFEHEVVAQHAVIVRVTRRQDKRIWFDFMSQQGVWSLYTSRLGNGEVTDEGDDEDFRETEVHQADSNEDFAACYSECFNAVPGWMIAVVSATCASCTTALALAPEPTTLSITCGACVLAIGAVVGNCILTCHEML